VRTTSEWEAERIDTPFPEYPRHIPKDDIIEDADYQDFLSTYDGKEIILYCKSGGRSLNAASYISSRGFNGTIYNMLGGITDWKQKSFPTKISNDEPNVPTIIDSPARCILNQSYVFSVQALDVNEDPIRYGWDFTNDGLVDKWSNYTLSDSVSEISYTFTSYGEFNVTVLAQDIVGSNSNYSTSSVVRINNPPEPPYIQGKSIGRVGKTYEYSIVSIDEDNDELSYLIDWGDGTTEGWTRTIPSGEELIISYQWSEKNKYTIKVKAKDVFDEESEWGTLEVQMPKSYFHFFIKTFFQERFFLFFTS
jgi:rhodanese-related sulfurtransferase